jgi:hypothetical protein
VRRGKRIRKKITRPAAEELEERADARLNQAKQWPEEETNEGIVQATQLVERWEILLNYTDQLRAIIDDLRRRKPN